MAPDDVDLTGFFFPRKEDKNPVALALAAAEDTFLVPVLDPLLVDLVLGFRWTVSPRALLRLLSRRIAAALRHSRLP